MITNESKTRQPPTDTLAAAIYATGENSQTSDMASRRTKELESDLSQVLAHGPAYRESFGKFLGALLMLYAITKTRRGAVGVATAVSIVGTFFYNMFSK